MARGLGLTLVALTMLLALSSAGAASAAGQRHAGAGSSHPSRPSSVPGQLIVSFRGGVQKAGRAAALGRAGASTIRSLGSPSLLLVSVRPKVEGRALGLLRGDARVRYAEHNGIGVAGVNWNVRLMALKFIGADGTGDVADAVRALHYATAMGAQVSNNSWGGDAYSQALADAITEADVHGSLFVAAAGNESSD